MKSEAALIYDSFLVLANTIDKYNLVDIIPASPSVSCGWLHKNESAWEFGEQFMKHLKTTNLNGLSGHIEFDQQTGHRSNLTIDIVDLAKNGLALVNFFF